jgi:septum formation protein
MLVLASRSPRRRALLRAAGIEFKAVAPEFEDGTELGRLKPAVPGGRGRYADLVRKSALQKALDVARREPGLILAADTVVVCEGEVMGKPSDEAEARRMLAKLSGRWHSVYTGIALVEGDRCLLGYERTEVAFRHLSQQQLDRYLGAGEPMDKAGAYAIQGHGAALIRAIRGCYTNVIGLPLPKVIAMLDQFAGGAGRPIGPRTPLPVGCRAGLLTRRAGMGLCGRGGYGRRTANAGLETCATNDWRGFNTDRGDVQV